MFKKILLASLIVVTGLALVTYVYFDQVIRRGVEIAGTTALGTSVTISRASLWPFSGSGSIHGLTIANVDGYESPHAIALETLDFQVAQGQNIALTTSQASWPGGCMQHAWRWSICAHHRDRCTWRG